MREAGLEMVGPFEMKRGETDGRELAWRLLVPEDIPWRRRWPFFIEWNYPDEVRLGLEGVGDHANGARSVSQCRRRRKRPRGGGRDCIPCCSTWSPSEGTKLLTLPPRVPASTSGDSPSTSSLPSGNGPVREALESDEEAPFGR